MAAMFVMLESVSAASFQNGVFPKSRRKLSLFMVFARMVGMSKMDADGDLYAARVHCTVLAFINFGSDSL